MRKKALVERGTQALRTENESNHAAGATLPGSTAKDRKFVAWERLDTYEIDVSARDWKPFGHNRSAASLPLVQATNCVCASSFRIFSSVASLGDGANKEQRKSGGWRNYRCEWLVTAPEMGFSAVKG
jgi:hypothetical protein